MIRCFREFIQNIIGAFSATNDKLKNKRIKIGRDGFDCIEKSIRNNYHTGWRSEDKYTKDGYARDLAAHLSERLESDRARIIPWIDDACPLNGRRILEIGCGTGSSAVALAEQGAKVVGIDVDKGSLCVARDRAKVYGIDAEFNELNADSIKKCYGVDSFDMIIFFASLEHMTIAERISSLADAWEMLRPHGYLIIIETPNRLWFCDGHTSQLPFFHWLPNELAFQYSKFSKRENFCELYREYTLENKHHFLRRGRGMSFHEIDVAICPVRDLKVVSSLSTYEGARFRAKKSKTHLRYKKIMMDLCPHVHEGFFDEHLDLIIQKSA